MERNAATLSLSYTQVYKCTAAKQPSILTRKVGEQGEQEVVEEEEEEEGPGAVSRAAKQTGEEDVETLGTSILHVHVHRERMLCAGASG